jgi:AcrR family transcriptional regulator
MVHMVTGRRTTVVRRRQIVSAARRLIVKYGSEHVTVRRIAKEIGVSEGAIYRHFKSKKEILSFLVDEIEDILMADIEGDDSTKAGGLNAIEVLERIIRHHVSSAEQRSGISFQVIAEIVSFGDKRLNKKIYDVIDEYINHIKDILEEGVKEGVIRQDLDLDAAATQFFSTIQGLVNLWALSNYSFNLEQRYAPVFRTFREAIVKH